MSDILGVTAGVGSIVTGNVSTDPLWMRECRAKGGHPTYVDGAATCYLPNADGTHYEPKAIAVINGFTFAAALNATLDEGNKAAGRIADALDPVIPDLPKPPAGWKFPAGVALAIGAVAVYAMGVQAGILPPLRRLFR